MKDGDYRDAETSRRKGRTGERSGDRVEKDGIGPETHRRTKHCCATTSGRTRCGSSMSLRRASVGRHLRGR
jgi:hypothetical protein